MIGTKGQQTQEIMLSVIRKMQIEITMTYHFTPTRIAIIKKDKKKNVGKDVEQLKLSYIADENVKWCSCCEKVWQPFKTLNIDLPYAPAIPLPHIHLGELQTCIHTKTWARMS